MLRLGASQFDAFITADQNVEFQQNLAELLMSVVVLVSRSTALSSVELLVLALLKLLGAFPPKKTLLRIGD